MVMSKETATSEVRNMPIPAAILDDVRRTMLKHGVMMLSRPIVYEDEARIDFATFDSGSARYFVLSVKALVDRHNADIAERLLAARKALPWYSWRRWVGA